MDGWMGGWMDERKTENILFVDKKNIQTFEVNPTLMALVR